MVYYTFFQWFYLIAPCQWNGRRHINIHNCSQNLPANGTLIFPQDLIVHIINNYKLCRLCFIRICVKHTVMVVVSCVTKTQRSYQLEALNTTKKKETDSDFIVPWFWKYFHTKKNQCKMCNKNVERTNFIINTNICISSFIYLYLFVRLSSTNSRNFLIK